MSRSTLHRQPASYEETLRRLSLNDETFVAAMLTGDVHVRRPEEVGTRASPLDDRTRRLVVLAALIAVDAGSAAIDAAVAAAFATGATPEDVVDVMLAVAPSVGTARVVTAAPFVAASVGYDLDGAFEGIPRQPSKGPPRNNRD